MKTFFEAFAVTAIVTTAAVLTVLTVGFTIVRVFGNDGSLWWLAGMVLAVSIISSLATGLMDLLVS